MIITIDGPAGSGKSSAAQILAKKLGIAHLDTGAMYRAIALDALEKGLLQDAAAIVGCARDSVLSYDWAQNPAPILLNGRNVADEIRRPEVTEITYLAADNPGVRVELVRQQQIVGQELVRRRGGFVTEGRDQGTVVFPNAEFKFYLDAAPEERSRRRIKQLAEKGIHKELSEILPQILQRDQRDKSRPVGPLTIPPNAIVIDSTPLTLTQVVDDLYTMITRRKA